MNMPSRLCPRVRGIPGSMGAPSVSHSTVPSTLSLIELLLPALRLSCFRSLDPKPI
jgi:hypothetical protein